MKDAREILAAATGAGNSVNFAVYEMQNVTIIASPDLDGTETADVQISHDNGVTWVDYQDGAAVELTASLNALRLYGPALYRVAKDSTATATGIYLQE